MKLAPLFLIFPEISKMVKKSTYNKLKLFSKLRGKSLLQLTFIHFPLYLNYLRVYALCVSNG